jgi:cell wall-associated NlpC family hydrolase
MMRKLDRRPFWGTLLLAVTTCAGCFISFGTGTAAGAAVWPHMVSSAAPNPVGSGYWDVFQDGSVTANGGVSSYGDMSGKPLNKPIIDITPTADGRGYWLLAGDGGIFTFGDARFFGSTGATKLNKPVVGMASTADGGGYWLVASDGGIFSFGDAAFYGSTGNLHLNAPIVGMAATPNGGGYWLVGEDGGVFAFGNANFFGSDPQRGITTAAVGVVRSQSGGYTVILSNGQVADYQSSLTISTTTTPNTEQGRSYYFQLTANGGANPLSWKLEGGALPTGLSLSPSGLISGLASEPETTSFTIGVTDGTGTTTTKSFSVVVGAAPSTLSPGQTLEPGQSLWSGPNGYWAAMQSDGNFVIYNSSNGHEVWDSGTSVPGSRITMQGDGNLVIYDPAGTALWSSDTAGNYNVSATMQSDSDFVLYGPTSRPLWSSFGGLTGLSVSVLFTGQTLDSGQELLSPDGEYLLAMQSDGNLVEYHGGAALWSSSTSGSNHLAMQSDGNLVVYSSSGSAVWSSTTGGHSSGNYFLVVQEDSNVVVYSPSNGPLWSTNGGVVGGSSGGASVAQRIVSAAASQAGLPYCFDGGGPSGPSHGSGGSGCPGSTVGFDCTGLTIYAIYQATGTVLSHDGHQGEDGGTEISSQANLQPGDLVFFGGTYANFEHAGVYAGGGEFWDANDYNVPVQEHSLAWEEGGAGGLPFVGGERF